MSIDYEAKYGIGYEVSAGEGILGMEDLEDCLSEYLETKAGVGFGSFTVGNLFSGEIEGEYLIIANPFENGRVDFGRSKILLDMEVCRLGLCTKSEFGLVGGLFVS